MSTKKKESVKKSSVLKSLIVKKKVHPKTPTPIQQVIYKFQKKFIFIPHCKNCDHGFIGMNKLAMCLSLLVIVLSGMLLVQTNTIDFSDLLVQMEMWAYL